MKVLCVIPARYASTRLPGKPLALIAGKPMIQHVYMKACEAKLPDDVIVATDNEKVFETVHGFGGRAIMTSPDHPSGTDRLAEVALNFPDVDVIVNVQGDEPMIPPEIIDRLAKAFEAESDLKMATMKVLMREEDYNNPAAVKVVTDNNGYALYFSRSLMPYPRNKTEHYKVYKHVGIYAYRRDFLLQYAALAPTELEKTESLEQLRVLENGYKIKVLESDFQGIGVDTPEDLAAVNELLSKRFYSRRRSDMNIVKVGDYEVGQGHPLLLMAGPCVLEGYEHSLMIGKEVKKIADKLGVPYVFKASYDKANRSSYSSFRGPGLEEGLKILAQIKKDLGVPVVSDIHETIQVEKAAEVLDILQIPAFLCRQTDLVYEAAKTGRVVNIKKGQFLAPWDMKNVLKKAEEAGNHNIMLTERGASFGYNALVTDMRSLAIMRELGYPVVMDATHSVQIPGGQGTTSGGQSQYVPHMARAAAAVGIDALFLEVHDNPEEALSDGPNMVRLDKLEKLLTDVLAIDKIVRG